MEFVTVEVKNRKDCELEKKFPHAAEVKVGYLEYPAKIPKPSKPPALHKKPSCNCNVAGQAPLELAAIRGFALGLQLSAPSPESILIKSLQFV